MKSKTTTTKISLVNNTKISMQAKNKKAISISGLGKIKKPSYRYTDICPNAME